MLAFKNNIYDIVSPGRPSLSPDSDYNLNFDPRHFIEVALNQDEEVLSFIERQPKLYWREDFQQFYPHAGRINSLHSLTEILRILRHGLNDLSCWHHMNSYHFCYIYDVLVRFSFNYNHDSLQEKLSYLPKLKGASIFLGSFITHYFFNRAFLVEPDHFNSLDHQKKLQLGYDCPHLFGVINGLTPTREEMALRESKDYPYTVFV
jgi:hypothetical protein